MSPANSTFTETTWYLLLSGMQPPLRVSVEIKKEKQETFALYFFSMYYLCISSFCLDWDITYLRNKMV